MASSGTHVPKKEEEAMRYVPSFNDFNSNVCNPGEIREHASLAAMRAQAGGGGGGTPPPLGPTDLAEGESAAAKAGPRSPAQVFADSLYESMRQT